MLQQFSQLLKEGSDGILNDRAAVILKSFNLFNFEVQFVRDGCRLVRDQFTFADVFFLTLAAVVITGIVFVVASAIRYKIYILKQQIYLLV